MGASLSGTFCMPGMQMCLEFRKEMEPKRLTVNCPSQEARGVIWVNIAVSEVKKARTQNWWEGELRKRLSMKHNRVKRR